MPTIRSLPLSSVKSLSATEAAALKRVGIDNTKELLEAASSTSAERALAKKAGLPTSVVREVTWTEPAVKGDTSGKVMKPAKTNTGMELPVPLFVEIGDKIEIDTRTGEYKNRVK